MDTEQTFKGYKKANNGNSKTMGTKRSKSKKAIQTKAPNKAEVYNVMTKFFMEKYFESIEDRKSAVSY